MMTPVLEFHPEKEGLETLFKDWQVTVMRLLWENPTKRYTTKEVWRHVTSQHSTISRATIYNFLTKMCRAHALKSEARKGRGGLRYLFYSEMREQEFREAAVRDICRCLRENLLEG
ncbi:MAG TPA: hypothetical protein ENF19_03140 [Candidatus Bathyarchaeota archaeon]|nr:hypothetical protein [Candidatus Bathyarchaeota archaeon]